MECGKYGKYILRKYPLPHFIFYYLVEKLEDTKWVIWICKLMKDRQHNGQKKNGKKDKQRSTKHTHKTNEKYNGG
jgi:hypothetical protein